MSVSGAHSEPAPPADRARRVLRRDLEARWLGGVASGISRRYGVDVWLVRFAFLVTAAAGGLGVAAYALGWLLIPAGRRRRDLAAAHPHGPRGGRGGTGHGPPAGERAPHLSGARHLVLGRDRLAARPGGQRRGADLALVDGPEAKAAAADGSDGTSGRPLGSGRVARARGRCGARRDAAAARLALPEGLADTLRGLSAHEGRRTAASISRTSIGVALVLAAGVVFLQTTGALSAARDVLLSVLVAVVVLGVIFAPWIVRLVRSLTTERTQRIRSQERAEVAAHLHDSVLQTLAMVQRRAGDPQEVAAIARRQERDLRAWLAGRPAPGQSATLAPALEAVAAEVEERYSVPVEVVVVGDRDLDAGTEAVVAAAREAMTNAAKFGGRSTVDVYAETADGRTQVFVRDRGPGFDPSDLPGDRRGVRESIVGRMERHGGRATITSAAGAGTEVELILDERA